MDGNHLETSEDDPATGARGEDINISDVIEVLETDPDFNGESNVNLNPSVNNSAMFNGGGAIRQSQPSTSGAVRRNRAHHGAYVEIVEQPASKALRFRYECEGRSAGSIPGASSTPENKTFPSIRIVGYKGRAVVVVSCVTKDAPFRPHPHNLVGREGCKKGVCTMEISPETMCVTFSNLGIQCIKKKDIESALRMREEIKVDPFMTGFSHRNQPTAIDLNAVRLCFQVFLEGDREKKFTVPLNPVVSEPIFDKKAMCDLIIVKLSHCRCYADGGRNEIILLCEKVAKEDIQVRFFEEKNGETIWEANGDFQPSQVHKQTAICFRPPRYHTLDITEPVKVFIQLKRPSDGAASEPLPFEFLPLDADRPGLKRKRIMKTVEDSEKSSIHQYLLNVPVQEENIKIERDNSPSPYNQMYASLSPAGSHQSMSPHHYMGGTTPPPFNNLPPVATMLQQQQQQQTPQQQWNLAPPTAWNQTVPIVVGNMVTNDLSASQMNNLNFSASAVQSFFNLDNQQLETELKPIELNSGDLATFETNNLSETFNQNLSLGDLGRQDQSMTDSLTRLANKTLESMCNPHS